MDGDQLAYVFLMCMFLVLAGAGAGGTLLTLKVMKVMAQRKARK